MAEYHCPISYASLNKSLHAAQSAAQEAGLDTEEFNKLAATEAQYKAGAFSEESVLDGLDPIARDRARRLHSRGFRRLPLSVQLHLEGRSTHYAPTVYNRLLELGAELEEFDAAIQAEVARSPGSKRLRELVALRDGPGRTILF